MSNDINILVTTELGDTLVKLDLAKHAVNDLGDESENAAAKQDAAAASTTFFQGAISGLNSVLTASVPLLGGMTVPLVALPVVAVVATAAVVALADAIGTLIAIAAAFVAPISVVTGLLGSLGLGFALAAKKAFGDGGSLHGAVGKLKDQFDTLTTTLAGRFTPIFQYLIHQAHDALGFLNQIAKLPLDQAFRQLAQKGIPAVTQFFEHIGHLAAKPIRLAFQIAFGQGKAGGEAHSAVAQMWNDFTNFLFGYTKTHPIRLPSGRIIQLDKRHVDGIFQPLIDWFNRHHFTRDGTKIGHEILNGLKPLAGPIGQFLITIFVDGMKTAVKGMLRAINPFSEGTKQKVRALNDWISHALVSAATAAWNHIRSVAVSAWNRIKSVASTTWNSIKSLAGQALTAINNHLGNVKGAISTVRDIASRFWGILQQIAGFFSRVFTFHVSWPSPPSWLSAVLGGLGGGSSGSTAGRTGQGGNSPGANVVTPNVRGAPIINVHPGASLLSVHGADLSNAAQRRVVAAQMGDALMRRWAQQAGR